MSRYAWMVLFGLSVLLAAASLYPLSVGVDPSDFESATGVVWSEFEASEPDVATYLVRLDRLTGAGYLGFSLLAAAIAWTAYRRGERWACYAMWLVPLTLVLAVGVFLAAESAGLAAFYGAFAVVTAAANAVGYKRFF